MNFISLELPCQAGLALRAWLQLKAPLLPNTPSHRKPFQEKRPCGALPPTVWAQALHMVFITRLCHPRNACCCLAQLQAAPFREKRLVHSASSNSKGRSKGQKLIGQGKPTPPLLSPSYKRDRDWGGEEGKLYFNPQSQGFDLPNFLSFLALFQKSGVGAQVCTCVWGEGMGESPSPGPPATERSAAIFNLRPGCGGRSGFWKTEWG